MKPEVALAGKLFDGVEEITVLYREWLEAYESIANEYPSVKDQVKMLTERIKRAYELFVERDRQKLSLIGDFCAVDVFMRELDRQTKAECDALDGDFILGNEKDMRFAARGFSVREIALIQLGLAHTIDLEATAKHVPVDFIRKGFLLELEGRFGEAAKTYRPANFFRSGELFDRVQECRAKAKAERERCPVCGSTDITNMDGSGVIGKKGENITLDICPEMWICNTCRETFRIDVDVNYSLAVKWRYTYDKEGSTKHEDGEDFYDLEEGAEYSLPYISKTDLRIREVKIDGETVTATVYAGYDTVTVSNKGEPVPAYATYEYSVCGDCVHEKLNMSLTIIKE